MSEIVSIPVNDISAPDRKSLENILGHPLASDQQVCVMVFSAATVPDAETRRAAAERIRSTLTEIDRRRTSDKISQSASEAAIEEAMNHVRPCFSNASKTFRDGSPSGSKREPF